MEIIKGNPENCNYCYFKDALLDNTSYCKRFGDKIEHVDTCPTGPLIQLYPENLPRCYAKIRIERIKKDRAGSVRTFNSEIPLDRESSGYHPLARKIRRALDKIG